MHGPGWGEVILGAALSLALGVVLGAVLLVLKPIKQVKELPKELERNTVYYIEGSHDSSKAKQALPKRKAFAEGQSVTVTEDEINSLIGGPATPPAATPPAKAGDKKAPEKKDDKAAAAASGEMLATGSPNVRLHDGKMQVCVPVSVNVLGVGQTVTFQARGDFEKRGDVFVFTPDQLYLGSCPVQRLPFLQGFVVKKFLESQPIPEDIATSWRKLASVSVEGSTLKLAMQ